MEHENQYDPSIHLSYGDLAVDNPSDPTAISMLIKKSKTDQGRKGAKIFLGKTGDTLCPVAAMEAYLSVRGSSSGPLFQWESGIPLSKSSFVRHVRTALEQAGLPAKDYARHSFRIGATTMGQWESCAFKRYIRLDPRYLASITSILAHCQL